MHNLADSLQYRVGRGWPPKEISGGQEVSTWILGHYTHYAGIEMPLKVARMVIEAIIKPVEDGGTSGGPDRFSSKF